jgi:hypothetical protein
VTRELWTSGPNCPACGLAGVGTCKLGGAPTAEPYVACISCGHCWAVSAEDRARARASDRAWAAELERQEREGHEEQESAKARARARELYAAAGRPIPDWARESVEKGEQ